MTMVGGRNSDNDNSAGNPQQQSAPAQKSESKAAAKTNLKPDSPVDESFDDLPF